jgi:hypothetical protein
LAVKTGAVAIPFASLMAVFTPPAKVPLAPASGGANVTVTLGIGIFRGSRTVTWN